MKCLLTQYSKLRNSPAGLRISRNLFEIQPWHIKQLFSKYVCFKFSALVNLEWVGKYLLICLPFRSALLSSDHPHTKPSFTSSLVILIQKFQIAS